MSVSVWYLESKEIVYDLRCGGREWSHRGLWVMDWVFFDGLLDIWYFSLRHTRHLTGTNIEELERKFPLAVKHYPLADIHHHLSYFVLCRAWMPGCNRGWLTESKAETAVSQHPARKVIRQCVRSPAPSSVQPIASSSLPPLLLSLPAPLPNGDNKDQRWR